MLIVLKGLIYEDFTPLGQTTQARRYFNVLDVDDDSTVNSENTIGSYIELYQTQVFQEQKVLQIPILSDPYIMKA